MRILVIDDTESLRLLLGQFFSTMGHEVVALAGGSELAAALATGPFDVVFTDVTMPDVSGWEVLGTLRASHPGVPVVMMTGWSDSQRGPDGLVPDATLSKPFGLDQLQAVLDTLPRR
jgi:DNA-binding response OmpR family regulator